jgi:cytochrome c-type biogenesis protein CcmH/NrfF
MMGNLRVLGANDRRLASRQAYALVCPAAALNSVRFYSTMLSSRIRCNSMKLKSRCTSYSTLNRGGLRTRIALTLAMLSFVVAPISRADNAERAKALSKKVMCMCGGCNDTAGTCNHTGGAFSGPCDTAKAMQKEVAERVNRGDSDDLILQSFVQEYGPRVLPDPPKKGFTSLVWIAPIAAPLIALFLIWEVVRRWRRRQILAPAGGPPISAELLDRARREADKDSHE